MDDVDGLKIDGSAAAAWRAPGLRAALSDLAASADTGVGLGPDGRVEWVNAAWDRFARENGGVGVADGAWIGRAYLDSAPPPVRAFYEALFNEARQARAPRFHEYVCHAPELGRRFRLSVTPVGERLVLGHHLVWTGPVPVAGGAPHEFIDARGIVVQCAHCRLVRRPGEGGAWAWVPALVEAPWPRVSHGMCPRCEAMFVSG